MQKKVKAVGCEGNFTREAELGRKIVAKLKRRRNCLHGTSHAPWKKVLEEAAELKSVVSYRNLQPCLKQSNKKMLNVDSERSDF